MAMANWDTFVLYHGTKPIYGNFETSSGVVASVYKNHLHVYDEKAWHDHSGFCKPVVAEFEEGKIRYLDLQVEAKRGPQNSILLVAWSGYGTDAMGMVGIGCYGYRGGKWIGTLPGTMRALANFLDKGDSPGSLKKLGLEIGASPVEGLDGDGASQ